MDPDFYPQEQEQANAVQYALAGPPAPATLPTPSLFAGFTDTGIEDTFDHGRHYDVLSAGVGRGLNYGAAAVAHVLTNLGSESDEFNGEVTEPAVKQSEMERRWLATAQRLTPDPAKVGAGSQAVMGLASMATQLAIGGAAGPLGAASLFGLSGGYQTYHELKAAHPDMDEATLEKMAATEGITDALYTFLPMEAMGKYSSEAAKIVAGMATGGVASIGLGMMNRSLDSHFLNEAGYTDLAQQYRALDGMAILSDAANGVIPAGLHGVHAAVAQRAADIANINGQIRDQISAMNDARASRQRGIGVPLTPEDAAAHQEAERVALEQTLRGDAIDLSDTQIGQEGANFVSRPQDAAAVADAKDLFANVVLEQLDKNAGLDHTDPRVQQVAQALGLDVPEAPTKPPEEPQSEIVNGTVLEAEKAGEREPEGGGRTYHVFRTFRGTGRASREEVYNGPAVPILGHGEYHAFEHGVAAEFGPTITQHDVTLKRPLYILSDEQWRALTREAGWEFPNPHGQPEERVTQMVSELQALIRGKGHDGVVVEIGKRSDQEGGSQEYRGRSVKTLQRVFGDSQVVKFGEAESNVAALTPRESEAQLQGEPAGAEQQESGAPAVQTPAAEQAGAAPEPETPPIPADVQAEMRRMAKNAGWAQLGGYLQRGPGIKGESGETGGAVIGRTKYVPKEQWFKEDMLKGERLPGERKGGADYEALVEKALSGATLKAQERRSFGALLRIATERVARMEADRAEMDAKVPEARIMPEATHDIPILVEQARKLDNDAAVEVLDAWNDDRPETIAAVRERLQEIINRGQEPDEPAVEGAGAPGGKGPESGGGLELTASPGDDELRAQRAAELQSVRTATEKRWADDERDRHPFTLTGSDRSADFNPRQSDLMDAVVRENPDATIIDQTGKAIPAQEAIEKIDELEAQANAEAEKGINAAADCAQRSG